MFLASHMVSGGLIFEVVKREPRWLKWPLFVAGAFLFHMVMDAVPVFHDMGGFPHYTPWQWFIAGYNGLMVLLYLWQFRGPRMKTRLKTVTTSWASGTYDEYYRDWSDWLKKVVLKRLGIGLTAWLVFDLWWLYRPWGNWLHGLAPNIGRWSSVESFWVEAAFMAIVCLLSMKLWRSRHDKRT